MRLIRKATDVVKEVRTVLKNEFKVSNKKLKSYKARVTSLKHGFPANSHFIDLKDLWFDYEVQRNAIPKHILNIMKAFDPRLCTPVSACRIIGQNTVTVYDGQQHLIAMVLLGYTKIPCIIVETDDPAFPSYAFEMLNEKGIKRLTPGDLHRNALTRYRLGSTEQRNINARKLQDQFDDLHIDLEDKATRKSMTAGGDNFWFFSHFKYAYKGIDLDRSGETLHDILEAIKTIFPESEEIDQGVYIGLYELARLDAGYNNLPNDWMHEVMSGVGEYFNDGHLVHSMAKRQWEYINPGSTWSAATAMANFIREVYMLSIPGPDGHIKLPYHGEGALMQVAKNPCEKLVKVGHGLYEEMGNEYNFPVTIGMGEVARTVEVLDNA
jgi:hypothetical protein